MKRFIIFAIVLWAAPGFAQTHVNPVGPQVPPVQQPTAQSVKEKVRFLLSGYEFFPTRKDLDSVGTPDDVTTILRDIIGDETARPSHRVRAVDAIGFYDDPDTIAFLQSLMSTPVSEQGKSVRVLRAIRHHAFTSLGRSIREASVPQLTPFLNDPDIQIRMTAISALGKFGGKTGRQALRDAKPEESNDVVRSFYRKYVQD